MKFVYKLLKVEKKYTEWGQPGSTKLTLCVSHVHDSNHVWFVYPGISIEDRKLVTG